jgi:hypothetical protein
MTLIHSVERFSFYVINVNGLAFEHFMEIKKTDIFKNAWYSRIRISILKPRIGETLDEGKLIFDQIAIINKKLANVNYISDQKCKSSEILASSLLTEKVPKSGLLSNQFIEDLKRIVGICA